MKRRLYLVIWEDEDGVMLGHLPLNQIPKESILWKGLREGDIGSLDNALIGDYEDYVYAKEHMKIEKAWRRSRVCKFRIEIITK